MRAVENTETRSTQRRPKSGCHHRRQPEQLAVKFGNRPIWDNLVYAPRPVVRRLPRAGRGVSRRGSQPFRRSQAAGIAYADALLNRAERDVVIAKVQEIERLLELL